MGGGFELRRWRGEDSGKTQGRFGEDSGKVRGRFREGSVWVRIGFGVEVGRWGINKAPAGVAGAIR